MPWLWRWNPDITCYTGIEYKEVLRKRYNLPDDWEPTPYVPPPPPGGYEDRDEPSTSPEPAPEADD
jgi:hypothetical protein